MTAITSSEFGYAGRKVDPGKRRKAIVGAYQGLLVDFIDIYLPVIALVPAIIYFQPADLSPAMKSTIYFMTFAATLLGRPIGALLFGSMADRLGRRRITMISVAGFSVCTLLIAFLPGYQTVGMWSIVLLVGLRFIDGIFLGGEYTAAVPLAYEYCDREKRGLVGGILAGAYCAAFVIISLVTLVMLEIAPAGGLDSPYVQWGWRVAFLFGAACGFAFLIYRRKHLPESDLWEESAKAKSPLRQVMFGSERRSFWQVFVLMTGLWLTSSMVASVVPDKLKNFHKIDATTVTWALLVTNVVLYAGFVAAGVTSQRVGRRKFLATMGIVIAVAGSAAYYVFMSDLIEGTLGIIAASLVVQVVISSVFGVATVYVNERFGTSVRSSGFAMGYSLSLLIPSFYSFYLLGLGTFLPETVTAIPLIVIGGVLILVGALWGPETKDLEFRPTGRVEYAAE
ncbi:MULTISPECIES: MFS transporter [Rhodococcus]|uniref:MFS transporter n=1 Tax=Rhodococcus oxybenzonivorans TaxID=1990687 RepID=A0AAE4UWQ4_9NOCA|nr:MULTISPECIES: MFS transporter [Rhodococcus]MDV7243371.1 MFS transporter [Rhodococcus oxybenzonivorans]MDV7263929.1 MFS transporter [Rhodococcus oxybenzonivorans]MDV7276797.1 MFS transporter [Rhodococcus oxybenzonivorans]MDV7334369.1 MFS transporter [Rhodococcus oxybenzonivorans]MDV7344524.1 MFS transporter [Rhodococcus oxybenzonivorans]